MQILKAFSITALLALGVVNSELQAQANSSVQTATPPKTIVIKHPLAANPDNFFSTGTAFTFEIFKAGDVSIITELLKKDANVSQCTVGNVTGDYSQISIALKAQKDKKWFAALFKKAGLNTIKINNNTIVTVDKM